MLRSVCKLVPRIFAVLVVFLGSSCLVRAQDAAEVTTQNQSATNPTTPDPASVPSDAPDPAVTMFPHSESSRYWISGQANVVFQWHPTFPAQYSGANSLTTPAESATTHIVTIYTGFEVTHNTELIADVEDATGGGIGKAVGLAGITDLDDVRTVSGLQLSDSPYLARLMLRQIIPLSSDHVTATRGPFGLATSLPVRRIEFRIGKFDLADFFDANSGGSDDHLQFLNWTVDNNGAWDYAADTRGYTDGAMIEYDDHRWAVRFAEALMPKEANGIFLDADIARARANNLEVEYDGGFLKHREGVIRILSYLNYADMGSYREAIDDFLTGKSAAPDITAVRQQGRKKYGFGLNLEQDITSQFGIFGRFGWNDGHNESFAYTEVDSTVELGSYIKGELWRRPSDRAGVVFVSNAISQDHREYLALGGLGFLLGDGALDYGREDIVESYYTAHLWRGLFGSFDLQHINNPGYNRARGPVLVPGLRIHIDF